MSAQDLIAEFREQRAQQPPQDYKPVPDNISGSAQDLIAEFREQRAQPTPQPQAPVPSIPPEQQPGTFEQVADIFTGGLRETPETEALSEVRFSKELNKLDLDTAEAYLSTMLSGNDEAKKDILQEQLGATFREDDKGNTFVKFPESEIEPDAEYVLDKPGISGENVFNAIGQTIAFFAPNKKAALAKSFIGKLLGGFAVGAGSELAIQGIEKAAGSKQDIRTGDVLLSGTIGSVGEAAPDIIRSAKGIRRTPDDVIETPEQTAELARRLEEARVGTQETGIKLLEPQATQIPSQLVAQRVLGDIAPTSQKIANELKIQNEQAHTAVEDFLNIIAPPEAIEKGATSVRSAAKDAIEQAKDVRTQAASPLYNRSFDESGPMDISNVIDAIDTALKDYPATGKIAKELNKAKKLMLKSDEDGGGNVDSLRVLHGAHQELGRTIETAGTEGLGGTAKRQITQIDKLLTDTLRNQSPLYAEAGEEFKRLSPTVKDLQEGVIGRLANVSDAQLKTVTGILFDPQESNPAVIKKAIQIINDVNPDATPAILRTYLEKVISKKPGLSDTVESIENVPGKLQNALFKTKKQRDMFNAAASPEAKKRADFLNNMLTRAGTGRHGGSDTAPNTQFLKKLRESAGSTLTEIIFSPRKTLVDWRKDVKFDKLANQLADSLVDSKGKWSEDWKKIMEYEPGSPKAYTAMAQMLARISEDHSREE